MASDTFKNMVVTFALIGLFIFLAVSFSGRMLGTYGIGDDEIRERLHYDDFEEQLNLSQGTAENWRVVFEDQNMFSVIAGIIVTGIFKIGKQMLEFIILPIDILALIFVDVLQIPQMVFNIIIFLIIVSAIFGLWSVLKKGD